MLGSTNVNPKRTHVVTGGTGFVGSALILELLQRTSGDIVALVRPKGDRSPAQRLTETLDELIEGNALPDSLRHEVATRVVAIAGDIETGNCGVSAFDTHAMRGAEFWHCAASLQYQDRHREQIERTNVRGTANVVQFARETRCAMFNMISTAYVVGSRQGDIIAEAPDMAYVNNCYERSKIMAEQQVLDSGLAARIMRPSVVIGHSQTHYTTSTDGLYGFIRNLTKFRNALERTQIGLSKTLSVSIEVDTDGRIDFVPVDLVVRDAVGLSNANADPDYYHLTNPTPPKIADAVNAAFVLSGLRAPQFVGSREHMTEVDLKLQQRIDFYSSYIINPKRFDRSSVTAVLGEHAQSGRDLEGAELHAFCNCFLHRLEGSKRTVAAVR